MVEMTTVRWKYDGAADAIFVRLRDGKPVSQEMVAESIIVDLDASGALLSVEVLDASQGWDMAEITRRFDVDERAQELIGRLSQSSLPRSEDMPRPTQFSASPTTLRAIHPVG